MTREELKEHCQRQIQNFERVEKIMPVTPNDWKRYEEHKLILELLEQEPILDKIRAEIRKLDDINPDYPMDRTIHISRNEVLQIIDKYKAESEGK
jgi:hypothetical protein